ncbi:YbhB/YbcL family Raf kinase inhibitor-like protein [Microbacterium sp. DT81.1]|uniref:YbhB/YbcL family Raf kinase inhibitor-like protein n=1 Tax=Microbacterium sp. DT81.1 TaxID=3393413 RepID=UPI003CF9AB01
MLDYDPYALLNPLPSFEVTSAEITDEAPIPRSMYAPDWGGESRSPALEWSGFPPATKSFAVTCFDPDAPTGTGFWHWAVYNIPASVTSLPGDAGSADGRLLPEGAITLPNEYRQTQFEGAGPPEGTGVHRYLFLVHAVDVPELDLPDRCTPTVLAFHLHYHSLARARVVPVGTYERS